MTWDAYQLSFSFSHSIFKVWEMTHLIFTENYYTLRSFHTLCVCPGYGPLQSVPRPTLIILNHIAWDSWVMILSSFLQPLFSSLTWIIQITFFVHQPSLLGMTIVHSFLPFCNWLPWIYFLVNCRSFVPHAGSHLYKASWDFTTEHQRNATWWTNSREAISKYELSRE